MKHLYILLIPFISFSQIEGKVLDEKKLNAALKSRDISKIDLVTKNVEKEFNNPHVYAKIKELQAKAITDIIYYEAYYPGIFRTIHDGDQLIEGQYSPKDQYIIYKNEDVLFCKKFVKGEFIDQKLCTSTYFFSNLILTIEQDVFISSLADYEIRDNKYLLNGCHSDHQPFYTLVYFSTNHTIMHKFAESDLECENNLFYHYNRNRGLYTSVIELQKLFKQGK